MKKLLLVLFAILCIGAFKSEATHMMGADVYYKCIKPGVYKITLKIYSHYDTTRKPTRVVGFFKSLESCDAITLTWKKCPMRKIFL